MTKLRIRTGDLEIDAEGEEQFVKNDVLELVKEIVRLQGSVSPSKEHKHKENSHLDPRGPQDPIKLTTSSIAAKLNAKSGPDLIIAAGAQLTFVQQKESFSRNDLLAEARTASAYYSENVRKNLSSHLNSLVKSRKLNEISVGVFAIHASARQELEAKISS
jgi:hypothetical protein